ncbi:MAG: Inner membrane protein YbiR [Pelotomaculum sp. PtaB.Bin013]|uniref:ArsB/NhaD family transporter n=1 Tax=Pelotomaculum isophthalicicum JI TaxID=947010 RepID=A0A9X4JW66_9FIRM|nr:ArsB/NhaD family transporter [Pelotomaculum isophthalicicum]MDF9408667.1 ArsB/NhaD family transporter [Pelotomaculum isophthalicicum JI]OPX88256.1 MAG: Inner membrane protein YbiR [Pelotomaculum sp. PtaB.Bin013]
MSESTQVFFATAVFLITYAVIVSEKIHRTVVALVGACLMALTKILGLEQVIEAIDFNTIGLLVGMMIIVGITKQTGIFEYLAIKAAKGSKGEPLKIIAALSLITAVLSAFLDNVTTVLLIVPVTFAIAKQLELNPLPFLIAEIISSNIGGTATLIGDPPNIMIGSATGLGFMDFVFNLTPVIVVIYILTIFFIQIIYRKQLVARPELQSVIMEIDEKDEIKDAKLLHKCLVVLFLTVLGFVLHQYVHLESSVIALSGASLLLLVTRSDPEHSLHAVEWPVIFFFVGLFVVVGALEEVGVIEAMAKWSLEVTGGNMVPTSMLILWLSAIASAFVDNIPFVATMIPLIQDMGRLGGIADLNLLWWSLSLGACLGGNGTAIGASANVVVIGIAEKRGLLISFINYMKIAFPLMLMSIVVSTGYLLLWHLVHTMTAIIVTLGVAIVLFLLLKPLSKMLTK